VGTDVGQAEDLLPLALSRPSEALARANDLLGSGPDDRLASIGHQVRAIVLRDTGRVSEAINELRMALRLATASGDASRATDVRATLGLTMGLEGNTSAGLRILDQAVAESSGRLAGRVLMRRGHLRSVLGRHEEAMNDFRNAIGLLHRAGDAVWEARARVGRFSAYARAGQAGRGDRDLAVAEELFATVGQELESAMVVHNRADVAFQSGDVPRALSFLDQAADRYEALEVPIPELAIDRCAVLLAAGLATEAVAATEEAIRRHMARGGEGTKLAELLFAVARAAQAAGDLDLVRQRGAAARDLFRRQRRWDWQARASFVVLQARCAAGERGGWGGQVSRLANRLEAINALEAPAAHLLAAQLATEHGRKAGADRHLERAARFRHRGPRFGHASGWLAHALRAESRGAVAAALAACRRGLNAAAEHQRALAAPELRAHAAAYGVELAALAQWHAVRRGDARMLLRWSERWRASALALPAVRPPDDRELATDLAALRDVMRRLDGASTFTASSAELEQERRRLEAAIRSRTRRLVGGHLAGDPQSVDDSDDLPGLVRALGQNSLIEVTVLDGTLYAITVVDGRVRLHVVGPVEAAIRGVDHARFLLRRLAYGRHLSGALRLIDAAGGELERVLLGSAAAALDGGPVVIVPPARLHAVPWTMLPTLRRIPVVVAPSAGTWLRAGNVPMPRERRVALVLGPGLKGTEAEVSQIADRYPEAVTLRDGRATAEATLAALDGAWTAHVAAHGIVRADNPLFSAVMVDDGPLTVYDLARLRRAPLRLVLSSCESGVGIPVGADELLGMMSALVPLGTASMLASIVPVNDAATAPLMVGFHENLLAGCSFSQALNAVRQAADADGDPIALSTTLSFMALGR
jgi:hypothetical protein